MKFINDNSEYLERKLSGEDVISSATFYGKKASESMLKSFLVIVLNETNYSFYKYEVEDNRFFVTDFKESMSHELASIIPLSFVRDQASMKWWQQVFFEREGLCTYDTYYDSLKIAEDSEMTFKEANERLHKSLLNLDLPPITSDVFLTGEIVSPMVRYNMQNIMGKYRVYPLLLGLDTEPINENEIVSYPSEKLDKFILKANGGIMLSMLALDPVNITLPVVSCQEEMLSGTKWEDMLGDQQKDYTVGNYDYKIVTLKVECDPFQNAFLSCQDHKGNRKVIQII